MADLSNTAVIPGIPAQCAASNPVLPSPLDPRFRGDDEAGSLDDEKGNSGGEKGRRSLRIHPLYRVN